MRKRDTIDQAMISKDNLQQITCNIQNITDAICNHSFAGRLWNHSYCSTVT